MSAPKGKAPTVAPVEASDVENQQQVGINMANSTEVTSQGTSPISIGGAPVRQIGDLYSLNDLHKASGGADRHRPSLFTENKQTKDLVAEIEQAGIPAYRSGRGKGTFACRELVIAYAAWISADFHLKVIRVFLAVTAPTPERAQYSVQPGNKLSAEQQGVLRDLLTNHAKHLPIQKQGRAMMQGWSKLKAHFGVSYRDIPASEFTEAVSIISRHVTEWELVDELPYKREETLNELVARLAYQLDQPNGYLVHTFLPLWIVINKRMMKFMRVDPSTGEFVGSAA